MMAKGTQKLKYGLKTLDSITDNEFTARQFVDKWLDQCGSRMCPHVAGARTIMIKLGCKLTGTRWKGQDLFRKPSECES